MKVQIVKTHNRFQLQCQYNIKMLKIIRTIITYNTSIYLNILWCKVKFELPRSAPWIAAIEWIVVSEFEPLLLTR